MTSKELEANVQKDMPDIRVIEQLATSLFPRSYRPCVERVEEGVSTYVYRIYFANEQFYLRILPEIGDSFAPEVYVHRILREKQVKVPEVIHFEHFNEEIGRSIILTSEIKGRHLGYCSLEEEQRTILREAGRDLAVINSLPVQGFGWIRRDSPNASSLEAEFPGNKAFIYEQLEHDLASLEEQMLTRCEVASVRQVLDRCDSWLDDGEQAWLAHADFDATHIYQERGHYTGIIDFGEIRGTHSLYDLGHFRMRDGETLPNLVLPHLIEGYRKVAPLPPDHEKRVSFYSLLIATRTLAQALEKRPKSVWNHQCLVSIRRDLEVLQTCK